MVQHPDEKTGAPVRAPCYSGILDSQGSGADLRLLHGGEDQEDGDDNNSSYDDGEGGEDYRQAQGV